MLLVRLLSDVCMACGNTTFNIGRNPIWQKRIPQTTAADGLQELSQLVTDQLSDACSSRADEICGEYSDVILGRIDEAGT